MASISSFLKQTELVYGIGGYYHGLGGIGSMVVENDQGVAFHGFMPLIYLIGGYGMVTKIFFKHIFYQIGVMNVVVLAAMLLLNSPDWRYFSYSFMVLPVMLLVIMAESGEKEGQKL